MVKYISPTIFTILLSVFSLGYAMVWFLIASKIEYGFFRIIALLLGLVTLGIIVALFYNLIERFKEIKEEDDDDLSKY